MCQFTDDCRRSHAYVCRLRLCECAYGYRPDSTNTTCVGGKMRIFINLLFCRFVIIFSFFREFIPSWDLLCVNIMKCAALLLLLLLSPRRIHRKFIWIISFSIRFHCENELFHISTVRCFQHTEEKRREGKKTATITMAQTFDKFMHNRTISMRINISCNDCILRKIEQKPIEIKS